jgi:hypothetical protein
MEPQIQPRLSNTPIVPGMTVTAILLILEEYFTEIMENL